MGLSSSLRGLLPISGSLRNGSKLLAIQTKPQNEIEENVMEEQGTRLLLGIIMVITTISRNTTVILYIYLLISETACLKYPSELDSFSPRPRYQ